MQKKTALRWGLLATLAIGAGATGAGLAAADTTAPDTPTAEDGSGSDTARMQQMDQGMQRMLETRPPHMRESVEQMHEQMRPMMKQMMSTMDDMNRMGEKDMGGMMGN